MNYITITGQENNIDHEVLVVKKPNLKYSLLLVVNILHFILTIIIAIFFAIVIYNLVIFRDNVDINKQISHIDYVTSRVTSFMDKNQNFFNNASSFMHQIEDKVDEISRIIENVCKIDPALCQ